MGDRANLVAQFVTERASASCTLGAATAPWLWKGHRGRPPPECAPPVGECEHRKIHSQLLSENNPFNCEMFSAGTANSA